jgi:hypothetical protein
MSLTEQQRVLLDSLGGLENPDHVTPTKYKWGEDFQRSVLAMLLCDRYFLIQARDLIQPQYFSNEVHVLLCRLLYYYFDKYETVPSKIFLCEEMSQALVGKETAVRLVYMTEVKTVYDFYTQGGVGDMLPGLDSREAILDKIVGFAKAEAYKHALFSMISLVKEKPDDPATYLKSEEIYNKARMVDRKLDLGLDYYVTAEERYARMAEERANEDYFTTGFQTIDNCLPAGGVRRGELACVMAQSGVGKSLNLAVASVRNLSMGKKVLYLTTEMDQDAVACRFDSLISSIGHHRLMPEKDVVFRAISEHVQSYEDKRRLVIKQFPSGTADVGTARAFLAQLKMCGFDPDLFIVDYPGDLKDSVGDDLWHSKFKIVRDLRTLGVQDRHGTFIAVQPRRIDTGGDENFILDDSKMADSHLMFRVFDLYWTLNQNDNEKKASVARVYIGKARAGQSRTQFRIQIDYDSQTLNMFEVTDDVYRARMARMKDGAADCIDLSINNSTIIGQINQEEGLAVGGGKVKRRARFNPSEDSEQ